MTMSSARRVNAWSFHANVTPPTYAPPPAPAHTALLHESWNAARGHWTVMRGTATLCDCGRRDADCRICSRGRR